jgi:protein TonB
MFEQSLVESVHHFEARRGWSTLAATALQSLAMALLIVLPLMQMQQMAATTERVSLPIPITTPPPQTAAPPRNTSMSDDLAAVAPVFVQPPSVPPRIGTGPEAVAPAIAFNSTCQSNCAPPIGVPNGTGTRPVLQAGSPHGPVVISHPDPAQILRQVQPIYPPIAKAAGIEGTVVLRAMISRSGDVENLETISGHPVLARAAIQAVQRWKFRPYFLNGTAVEVQTQITVNFHLSHE